VITVEKPAATPPEPVAPVLPAEEPTVRAAESQVPRAAPSEDGAETPRPAAGKSRLLGIRGKMIFYFFIIPIVLMAAAGALFLLQLNDLTSLITSESSKTVTKMAEQAIIENARSVASQVRLYIQNNPHLKREDFNRDAGFKRVAIQKVGLTGYSCIYSVPDEKGLSSLWAHPNAKLIGIDVPKAMKKPLGKEYHRWWGVYKGAYKGRESRGYYLWQDADGRLREKYMVCTPVEGTPYVVASTTYLDEFTRPMKVLESRAKRLSNRTMYTVVGIVGITLILIGIIVSLYGHALTSKVKRLTEVTDRISVGELDAEVEIKSKDELGDLSEAISRMQDSIRLSIERLRRRR
jgi:HAMP domain-containing protein